MAVQLQIKATKQGPAKDFLMMTAHVKSGDKMEDLPAKKSQGKEVADIIAQHNQTGLPVIFACDFNNKPGGDAHIAFFKKLLCKKRCGLALASAKQMKDLSQINRWRAETIVFQKAMKKLQKKKGISAAEIEKSKKELKPMITFTAEEFKQATTIALAQKTEVPNKKCEECHGTGFSVPVTSAYGKVGGKFGPDATYSEMVRAEPAYTTDKWRKGGTQKDKRGKTKQTIDYIFYTEEFECSRVLNITKEKIEPVHMPGWKYPSDHFCIAADLTFSTAPTKTRRMAQREFSSRRDSPAMVRLLQQIVDAQDANK